MSCAVSVDDLVEYVLMMDADISYYKHTSGMLGQAKEIGGAVLTGKVAQTGVLRELKEADIEQARKSDSALTS